MLRRALNDLLSGLGKYELWIYLSWQEVRQRYRRSILGPLWITMSMGVFITFIGPLYSKLFKQNINEYLLGLTLGFIVWNFISSTINDFSQTFISSEQLIKQTRLPYSIYIYKTILRNLIIFGHNFFVIIVVYFFFPSPLHSQWTLLLIGLPILILNLIWMGIFISMVCTRYRDLNPLVANLIQISFFLTPIIWKPEALANNTWILKYNIFFHFIELVRSPLVNSLTFSSHLGISMIILAIGMGVSALFYGKYINRISYWI